jgi:N4-gp56 family major capsid protein
MADNNFNPGNTTGDALKRTAYAEKVWREQLAGTVLSQFATLPNVQNAKGGKASYIRDGGGTITGVRNNSGEAIRIIEEFGAMRGDTIQFASVAPLSGTGITGTSGKRAIDNAEQISASALSVTLEEYIHSVKDTGPLGRKRLQFDVEKEYIDLLVSWGVQKVEQVAMDALFDSPSTIIYPSTYTAASQLTSADTVSLTEIRKAKLMASTRGAAGRNIIEPLKINGKDYYVALLDPEAMFELKNSSEYKQMLQNAGVRGPENDLFKGADFITFDGIVCYQTEYNPRPTTYGSGGNLPGSRIKLFGKDALLMGFGMTPTLLTENTDFQREKGLALQFMMAAKKPKFNSKDFGSVELRVARTPITGY